MSRVGTKSKKRSKATPSALRPFVVAILALIAMGGALNGEFILDDLPLIQNNSSIQSFSNIERWFSGGLWDTSYVPNVEKLAARYWRPATLASYAANWAVAGNDPFLYHLTNLLLHALNAVLLFRILLGWSRSTFAAFAGATFFAIHPALTECVTWISGRPDVLCTTGLLISLLGIRKRGIVGFSWAAAGAVLAFMSKEAAIILPILVVVELASEKRKALDGAEVKRLLKGVAPALLVAVAFLVFHVVWRGASKNAPYGVTWGNKPLLVLEAYGRYLQLAVLPHDINLLGTLFEYEDEKIVPHLGFAALGLAALAGGIAAVLRLRRGYSPIAWGWLAFVGLILPVSGIHWLGYETLIACRFLYVPLIGGSLVVGSICALPLPAPWKAPRLLFVTAYGAALLSLSHLRSRDYQTSEQFWKVEILHNPGYGVAAEHFVVRELNAGRPNRAAKMAAAWFQAANGKGGQWLAESTLLDGAIDGLLAATPDKDKSTLQEIERCTFKWANATACTLKLPDGSKLEAGQTPVQKSMLAGRKARYLLKAANAASRLGHHETNLAAIAAIEKECPQCWTLLSEASVYAARSGDLPRATGLLQTAMQAAPKGAVQTTAAQISRARALWEAHQAAPSAPTAASYYVTVGAYGLAYKYAAPSMKDESLPPGAAPNLALIAFLAGYEAEARKLLSQHFPPDRVEAFIKEASIQAPHIDKPTPPGTFIPKF